jgi:DNA-binding MarR family transcriptional regulator
MGKHAQIGRGRKVVSVLVATSGGGLSKPLRGQEWRKDLLTSWLFQTCIKLQTSLDRRFLRFGMTVQEANVLLCCVQARRITPGQLAIALGRDKGKITRFVDRLESSRLLTRDIDPRDRRFSILKPTAKGKQAARVLASVYDSTRKELFAGILESDVIRLGKMLPQLHKNALQIGKERGNWEGRRKRRIGERNSLPNIKALRLEETCAAVTELFTGTSDIPNFKEHEARDSGLVQTDRKDTVSQPEEVFSSLTQVLLSG